MAESKKTIGAPGLGSADAVLDGEPVAGAVELDDRRALAVGGREKQPVVTDDDRLGDVRYGRDLPGMFPEEPAVLDGETDDPFGCYGQDLALAGQLEIHSLDVTDRAAVASLAAGLAGMAIDGLITMGWIAKDADKRPKITLRPEQPIRANTLVLCHAQHGDGNRSRPKKVAVKINGRVPLGTIDMVMDNRRKTIFRFPGPKVIRSLELTIVETNNKKKKGAGFGEVELQLIKDER